MSKLLSVASAAVFLGSCSRDLPRDVPNDRAPAQAEPRFVPPAPAPLPSASLAPASARPRLAADARDDVDAAPPGHAGDQVASGSATTAAGDGYDGPLYVPLGSRDAADRERPVFYALPRGAARPLRVVAHLHGMCGPPSYACGKWIGAGTSVGALICPTGNARCGDSPVGPPSWDAPSWPELVAIMDADLERAIAKVEAKHPGATRREGRVLTGYSRGAYAAAVIARKVKGRWPYLVLIEADASLPASSLRAAGVKAVALVAGEQGNEIAGMRGTAAALEKEGFPVRLFVMRNTGHLYSLDMERVMTDALAFVLSY